MSDNLIGKRERGAIEKPSEAELIAKKHTKWKTTKDDFTGGQASICRLIEKAPTRKITDFNSNLKGVPAFEADDESTLIYFGDYANLVDEHRGPLSFKIKRIRHNTMTSLENVDEFDIWHWAQVTTSN
ncbi:hypothetical protein Tco_1093123 [Tanacetum coccineum]|uniref:Uncharacterized protein n=1 Tax=Tanacetum coccineum TaxID=301880 RepID=A0ABQ5ID56_9ASTR